MKKDRVKIIGVSIVWGEIYVNTFLNYTIPSLLAPGNIPKMLRYCDGPYRIYTTEDSIKTIGEHPAFKRLASLMPVEFGKIEPQGDSAVNYASWIIREQVVPEAIREQAGIVYCIADMVWTNGALGRVGKSFASGNNIVFMPELRVVHETAVKDLEQYRRKGFEGSLVVPPEDAPKLVIKHLSPLSGCYGRECGYMPDHGELLLWPAPPEGLLMYRVSRDSTFFRPHALKYNHLQLFTDENDFARFDTIADTSCFGLGLTPLQQNLSWLRVGKSFDPVRLAQFMATFPSAHNAVAIQNPIHVSLVRHSSAVGSWLRAKDDSYRCFVDVYDYINLIMQNRIEDLPPKPPKTPPLSDVGICRATLSWLEPIIAGRFEQSVLKLLDDLYLTYPNGMLPDAYSSCAPLILPERP